MKRLAILALAALLLVPVSVNAQRKNENLGKKYGPYEVKIGKGKYMKDAPVTAIWNNETKVWVTSPIIDKKNGGRTVEGAKLRVVWRISPQKS